MPSKTGNLLSHVISQQQLFERILGFGARSEVSKQTRQLTLINLASFSAAISSATYAFVFAIIRLSSPDAHDHRKLMRGSSLLRNAVLASIRDKYFGHLLFVDGINLVVFIRSASRSSIGNPIEFHVGRSAGLRSFRNKQLGRIAILLTLSLILHLTAALYFERPFID